VTKGLEAAVPPPVRDAHAGRYTAPTERASYRARFTFDTSYSSSDVRASTDSDCLRWWRRWRNDPECTGADEHAGRSASDDVDSKPAREQQRRPNANSFCVSYTGSDAGTYATTNSDADTGSDIITKQHNPA
jgi:hypothetical protein